MFNLLVVVMAGWAILALATTVLFSRVQVLGKQQARLVRSHRVDASPLRQPDAMTDSRHSA